MLAFSDAHRAQASGASEPLNRRGGARSDLYEKSAEDYKRSAEQNEQIAKDIQKTATEISWEAKALDVVAIGSATRGPIGVVIGVIVELFSIGLDVIASALNDLADAKKKEAEREREKAQEIEIRELERQLRDIREGRGAALTGPHGDALAPSDYHDSDMMHA